MACADKTPWTITEHSYPVYRQRTTAGGATSQSTGAWIAPTTSSLKICGSIGRGTVKGTTGLRAEDLKSLAGGQFKTGDQYFVCHSDCDVALNDIIDAYDDAAGTSITKWRVITKLKALTTFDNLMGYGQNFWLIRMEAQ